MSINKTQALKEAMSQYKKNIGIILVASPAEICLMMMENDPSSPLSQTQDVKPDREIFEASVSSVHTDEMKEKKILGYYVFFYAIRLLKYYQYRVDADGYLTTNPLIWEKISKEECAYVAQLLDPGAVKDPELLPVIKHIFKRFLNFVSKKDSFAPAPRWREIKGTVAKTMLRAIVRRFEKTRFVNEVDEAMIVDLMEKFGRQRVRDILIEIMEEQGLHYPPPICKNYDAYLNVYAELGGKSISVLPLDTLLYFEVINWKALIKKGAGFNSVRFQLEVYVPVKDGKKITHKTLIEGEFVRTSADQDGKVIFSGVKLNAKVSEPEIGEYKISSINSNNEQIGHILGKVIILPEGEPVLKVKNKKFREVIELFVNMGLMTEDEAQDALSGLPPEEASDIELILSIPHEFPETS